MGMVIIQVLGLILVVWSVTVFVRMNPITPSYIFSFSDGVCEFDVESPGVYSIAVLDARSVSKLEQVDIRVEVNNSDLLKVNRYIISPRFRRGGEITTGCWYFTVESQGHCRLSFSNLRAVEAKESMLTSRIFQEPIDSSKLKIIIHKSVKPLYLFLSFVGFSLGLYMIMAGYIWF